MPARFAGGVIRAREETRKEKHAFVDQMWHVLSVRVLFHSFDFLAISLRSFVTWELSATKQRAISMYCKIVVFDRFISCCNCRE